MKQSDLFSAIFQTMHTTQRNLEHYFKENTLFLEMHGDIEDETMDETLFDNIVEVNDYYVSHIIESIAVSLAQILPDVLGISIERDVDLQNPDDIFRLTTPIITD